MEPLILRLASRHGRGASWHRLQHDRLSVGRSPRNTVIVDDPYIGAEQFLLHPGEDEVILEVLDHTNPIFINRRHRTGERLTLRPGDRIEIGHTALTLLAENGAVEPTRVLSFAIWSRLRGWQPLIAIAMLLLMFSSTAYLYFLEVYQKPDWGEIASQSLLFSLVLVVWAAVWAIVGRLLRGQPLFFGHLFVTSAAVWVATLCSFVLAYAAYASGFTRTISVVDSILEALLGVGLLFCNLRLATHLRRPALAAALFIAVVTVLAYGVAWLDEDEFNPGLETETLLKPPLAKLRPGRAPDDYEASLRELFVELREDAAADDDGKESAEPLAQREPSSSR